MRLRRLDLTRYGKFTDFSIDFALPAAGEPDLHVVYGPNEAGKSTAMRAYLDLLFGIEPRTPYGFLHDYSAMRIGGSLELAAGARELVRLKRQQNSLLDGRNQPVAEAIELAELRGIDRDAYRAMFSLDDDTLEAGGDSILESKGDLGQLLFSASAGLSDLTQRLASLRDEADRFYRPRARSGLLADLKIQLAELRADRERLDTLATAYGLMVKTRDQAQSDYSTALRDRAKVDAELQQVQRVLGALPKLDDLRMLRERLRPLQDLPDAPTAWRDMMPVLVREEIELSARSKSLDEQIAGLEAERDGIAPDELALRHAGDLAELEEWRARHTAAEQELPEERAKLREAEESMSRILARIGCDSGAEPSDFLLGAAISGALITLMDARSGIEADARSTNAERKRAEEKLDETEANFVAAGGASGDRPEPKTAALVSAISAARSGNHEARQRDLARALRRAQGRLTERLRDLEPWTGGAAELRAIAVPETALIERWRANLATARAGQQARRSELESLDADMVGLRAELDAFRAVSGVVGDADAGAVRSAREQAWADHRRVLDAASADAFEAAMRRDDLVGGARLAHASELARLHQLAQSLALVEAKRTETTRLDGEAQAALQALHREIDAAAGVLVSSIRDDIGIARLERWLAARNSALEAWQVVGEAERELQDTEADAAAAVKRLQAGFTAAGIPFDADASLEILLGTAQLAVDGNTRLMTLAEAVEHAKRELRHRQRAAAEARAAEQAWEASWTKACAGCWLGQAGSPRAVAEVREILSALTELPSAIAARNGHEARIGVLERHQAAFAERTRELGLQLGIPVNEAASLGGAAAITSRVQQAAKDDERRAEKERALVGAIEARRQLASLREIHDRRRAEVLAHFSVDSLNEAAAAMEALALRAELQSQLATMGRDLTAAVSAPSFEEAERILEGADRRTLEEELSELGARHADLDQRARDLFAAHSKAHDAVEAVGGDDVVAKLEERRRTTLLAIEDGAARYLRLRVGVASAEQALRLYRDRHRSSMLARASEAFRTITRDEYRGLSTQPDKDGDMLIALTADGGSKTSVALSKGTRFQLYLALRVAGYHEFAATQPPVPFIADDIMETFDDLRAEQAFRLLAEMAFVGQVIYFTHHQHLCDIARRLCPSAAMHALA